MFIVTECNSIRWIWNDCTKGNINSVIICASSISGLKNIIMDMAES